MKKSRRKICVIGLGYIGLPTASLLGTKGYQVYGVDTSKSVVETINKGEIHIVEPDLDILVKSAVQSGKLSAGLKPKTADVFIIAVPTPFKEEHKPDLSFIESATHMIKPHLKKGNLVILESTSPVGTTDGLVAKIIEETGFAIGKDIFIAHCPERVLPGRILIELIENDRIVGGINQASTAEAVSFYKEFVRGEVLPTDSKTAEMTKLTENAFRDVNIAFANELSLISDKEKINVWELINLANRHPRVNILQPGPGVGGHCIAVDPWFIISRTPKLAKIIRMARNINDYKPFWIIEKVRTNAKKLRKPVIGCLGLAYKANVDDLRESPSVMIVHQLIEENLGTILVSEPNIHKHDSFELHPYQSVVEASDILLLLVDHDEFRSLKASELKEKIIIDTRGIM